jgi:hypothetical protein
MANHQNTPRSRRRSSVTAASKVTKRTPVRSRSKAHMHTEDAFLKAIKAAKPAMAELRANSPVSPVPELCEGELVAYRVHFPFGTAKGVQAGDIVMVNQTAVGYKGDTLVSNFEGVAWLSACYEDRYTNHCGVVVEVRRRKVAGFHRGCRPIYTWR